MKLILRKLEASGPAEDYVFHPPGPVVVGRDRDCAIRVERPTVSRRHCAFSFRRGRWLVDDLGGRNGILVNGEKVWRAELNHGDTISAGDVQLRVRLIDRQDREQSSVAFGFEPEERAKVSADQSAMTEAAAGGRHALDQVPDMPRVLGNRYELGQVVHQGSTGVFYRARDAESGETVCVKVLAPRVTADEAELKRFVRGVHAAEKLHHPNIVRLYRAGHTRRGQWWLAMEYVDGLSLRQVVAKYGVGSMLAPARVLAVARDIVAALEVAYEREVMHRNIRPDNILLTQRGVAKLSNFSLARGVVLSTMQRISTSGELVGDVAFMAPERAEPGGAVDCRSDIYALGACLYTLLAGRPPFTGRGTADLLERVRHESAVPPSRVNLSVPGPLEGIVMRCLAKSPTERFQSPMELREELARVAKFQGLWT